MKFLNLAIFQIIPSRFSAKLIKENFQLTSKRFFYFSFFNNLIM